MHSFPNLSTQKTRGHHPEKRAGLGLILPNNLLQLLNLKPVPFPLLLFSLFDCFLLVNKNMSGISKGATALASAPKYNFPVSPGL